MAADHGAREAVPAPPEAVEPKHRVLTLSVPRVEVRLYRSSRTSSDPLKRPPHFVYTLRCDWNTLEEGEDGAGLRSGGFWWDGLPQSYTVKRRWLDIVRFHEVLKSDLGFDPEQGCRRVRARVPDLPDRGELDKFVVGVAATGDACALNRQQQHCEGALEELDNLHYLYCENRLNPYFADVNRVLAELPPDVLHSSVAFRKLVTCGVSCGPTATHPERFCGPGPTMLDRTTVASASDRFRRTARFGGSTASLSFSQRLTEGGWRGRRQPARAPATPPRAGAAPARLGASSPASQSAPSQRAARGLPKSASAPVVAAAARDDAQGGADVAFERTMRPEEVGQPMNRLASTTHYSFFAKALPRGEYFGCDSTRDFWKRMSLKETREVGRRTLCQVGGGEESPFRTKILERLPALPPPGAQELFRLQNEGPPAGPKHKPSVRKEALSTPKAGPRMTPDRARAELAARDVCEGLRVLVLGDQPSQVPRSMRRNEPLEERAAASREEAVKVYRTYRALLEMRAGGEPLEPSSSEDESRREGSARSDEDGEPRRPSGQETRWSARGLAQVSWSALFTWVRNKEDFASDYRHRSVCAALVRALKDWRRAQAGRLHSGSSVHLSQLFQWIWPEVTDAHIATMFTWVCLLEIEKIRQPTPRVIEGAEAKRLEKIFRLMSGSEGRDYVTPEEIAGGRDQGVDAKLKNIVDRETVVAVCGDREIQRTEFLELMCEDDCRAHEDAGHVVLRDGRRVARQAHPELGVDIWVLEEEEAEEAEQRFLVGAIEAEVRRWRRRAELRGLGGSGEAPPTSAASRDVAWESSVRRTRSKVEDGHASGPIEVIE